MRVFSGWRFAFWLAIVAVSLAALAPVSYLPSPVFSVWDKAQHTLVFGMLTLLGCLAFPQRGVRVIVGLLGYAAVIELAQEVSGLRTGDWKDWLADAIGVAVTAIFCTLRRRGLLV